MGKVFQLLVIDKIEKFYNKIQRKFNVLRNYILTNITELLEKILWSLCKL